ncbi:MAG: hypothetical protein QW450_00550 [Candidatus Nitrosocaldus sp.]
MKRYIVGALATLSLLSLMLSNAYALGAPQPLSKPPGLIVTYLATLLTVLFFMLVQHLIRKSFYSKYRLVP